MAKEAKVLSSKEVYRGPVFWVTTDWVQEPGGPKVRRDVVRHPGSVVLLCVDDTGHEPRVLLVRQYRHAAQQPLWELPAGRIDEDETELDAARRELEEETGYSASHWSRALYFYASPGFLDETMAVWMATGLKKGRARPEEDEVISKRFFALSAAIRMVMHGKVHDGKTISGVLWLEHTRPGNRRRP